MWIRRLRIENFRGIRDACVDFSERQTVLIGANGAGKSTIIESLALLFGRDRLVRTLTEHDFFGSDPQATDRIRLTATITGFSSNEPSQHAHWFSAGRGVPKWISPSAVGTDIALLPEPQSQDDHLCVQVAYCARFDRVELFVESVRYFHDDDSVLDPFDEELTQPVSNRFLTELGFFLVPAHRTWDRLVSFSSELFRRILESTGDLEGSEVLKERDRLRQDDHRIDRDGSIGELLKGMNKHVRALLPNSPELELRLTGTDTDSILHSLVPHYRNTPALPLPAVRHGSGLLSLQTALLILQIAERRLAASQNVIIAVEEPELHMPPGVQVQVLQRLRDCSHQLLCTTHSPRVGSVYPARDTRVISRSDDGQTIARNLLLKPLSTDARNGIRKLFHDHRQSFVEAIMHQWVLVPEGRTDVEWLRFLARSSEADELSVSSHITGQLPFGACFGITPTHDGCVVETVASVNAVRKGVLALVDGDSAGDDYVAALQKMKHPPDAIIQWPKDWEIEDVVGWILSADPQLVIDLRAEMPSAPLSVMDVVMWLKLSTSEGGAKTDYLAYEVIAGLVLHSPKAKERTRDLLDALGAAMRSSPTHSFLLADMDRSGATPVWRVQL